MACYETGQSPWSGIDSTGSVGVGESSVRRVLNEDPISEVWTFISIYMKKKRELRNEQVSIAVVGNSGVGKSSFINTLRELRNEQVNIAVVGNSGVGKSSFINTLRGLLSPRLDNVSTWSVREDTSSMIRDDNFCKTVLNRSIPKLSHKLDPYSLFIWCKNIGYLTYQQVRDYQKQTLYNHKTRELLKAVSSRGASGYKEMKRWLFTHHVYLFHYLGEQEAELENIIMAGKEIEQKNRQARPQKPLQTGTLLKDLDPLPTGGYFKTMLSEDEYSVIQKFRKQTQKSRKSQLIDFCSPFHEIQEMVLYMYYTKMTVTESRTIASGCTDPYQDIYRTSAYLLILFGLTAFEEKQALEQVMESMWKHIFWNESLSTYSLSDKNEKETKDVEESITASGKELLKNEAPVEVSVNIDNVSMEEEPTAGSYDKQAAEDFLALEQMLMCKVCLDVDICIVFLPCRHTATCESCASVLQSCPVCRSEIQASIKLNYE